MFANGFLADSSAASLAVFNPAIDAVFKRQALFWSIMDRAFRPRFKQGVWCKLVGEVFFNVILGNAIPKPFPERESRVFFLPERCGFVWYLKQCPIKVIFLVNRVQCLFQCFWVLFGNGINAAFCSCNGLCFLKFGHVSLLLCLPDQSGRHVFYFCKRQFNSPARIFPDQPFYLLFYLLMPSAECLYVFSLVSVQGMLDFGAYHVVGFDDWFHALFFLFVLNVVLLNVIQSIFNGAFMAALKHHAKLLVARGFYWTAFRDREHEIASSPVLLFALIGSSFWY